MSLNCVARIISKEKLPLNDERLIAGHPVNSVKKKRKKDTIPQLNSDHMPRHRKRRSSHTSEASRLQSEHERDTHRLTALLFHYVIEHMNTVIGGGARYKKGERKEKKK